MRPSPEIYPRPLLASFFGIVFIAVGLSAEYSPANPIEYNKMGAIEATMKNSAIVSPDNKIVRLFIEPEKLWRWNEVFDKGRLITLESEKKIFATDFINPISFNPKVRHFKYSFELNASAGLPAKLQILRFEKERGRTLEQELEYWATEFVEKNSKDISVFYNRLDTNQQQKFFQMAKDFINPKIKSSGTQLVAANFNLPS